MNELDRNFGRKNQEMKSFSVEFCLTNFMLKKPECRADDFPSIYKTRAAERILTNIGKMDFDKYSRNERCTWVLSKHAK